MILTLARAVKMIPPTDGFAPSPPPNTKNTGIVVVAARDRLMKGKMTGRQNILKGFQYNTWCSLSEGIQEIVRSTSWGSHKEEETTFIREPMQRTYPTITSACQGIQ